MLLLPYKQPRYTSTWKEELLDLLLAMSRTAANGPEISMGCRPHLRRPAWQLLQRIDGETIEDRHHSLLPEARDLACWKTLYGAVERHMHGASFWHTPCFLYCENVRIARWPLISASLYPLSHTLYFAFERYLQYHRKLRLTRMLKLSDRSPCVACQMASLASNKYPRTGTSPVDCHPLGRWVRLPCDQLA